MRMLFICGESPIFSDQIGIKRFAVWRAFIMKSHFKTGYSNDIAFFVFQLIYNMKLRSLA